MLMLPLLLLCASVGAWGSGEAQKLQALHCPPCERIHCSTRRALRLQCKGGVTTGVCGCCPVCAKTEGESCGGTWDHLGKCDEGLVCMVEAEDVESRGSCKSVIEDLDPESCQPECTKDYCQANPFAVCSARFASLEKKSCQGSCQHTSCSSCFMLTPPSCPHACSPTDSTCLQLFGKCVRSHLRARPHVCHSDLQNTSDGHFMCLLPSCSN
ncbi:Venom protein 302 [Oryzias melastigma]|uniref:Venom protein 302 n=1 Tax=Oryzias melastigma TaxID=30732 RepID=A0A834FQW8_ORYME|nr:IGFBP domain-containing protein [Oryzias melastigma]KAF6738858.1 Venom protein 302 [Oryzias melastigma]KAF6738918.1 Venom protein 302 [Oryzias melastigma]